MSLDRAFSKFALSLFGLTIAMHQCTSQLYAQAREAVVLLRNNMTIGPGMQGSVPGVDTSSKSAAALNENINPRTVTVIDDNLRLTFFKSSQIQSVNNRVEPLTVIQTKNIELRANGTHPRVLAVLSTAGVTPFDDFGRRIYSLATTDGSANIQQGITEVSSNFIRVEGLNGERTTIWDMRLALNAIEPDRLRTILFNQVDLNVAQNWLDIVNVFREAERYREAREILQKAIARHPELENLRPQLRVFDEANAELMFAEVGYRYEAGQYKLAKALLEGFDRRNVATQTNVKIDRRITTFREEEQAIETLKDRLDKLLNTTSDAKMLAAGTQLINEIKSQLSIATLPRFADLQQLDSNDERALAVAISNWLLGSGNSVNSLPVASSLIEARELITEYLSTADADRRTQIIERLRSIEAGSPDYIAKIAAQMRPPLTFNGTLADPETPGRYTVEVPIASLPNRTTRYIIQLPPEYDPNRKYPCIFAIPGEFAGISQELNWWSGTYNKEFDRCMGEASRHGYVVISPEWIRPKQLEYEYTENEHATILACLRDAFRRCSIDTDRVFLAGHHMGGDAAWDIGLAHPDLWAGMIVIGGDCAKYPHLYYENGVSLPMYFVVGELDGAPNALSRNGKYLDKFMASAQFDCMVVMYRGRGRDHFQEELGRIIKWSNLSAHRRNFAPTEFEVCAARPGDNFFWCLEVRDFKQEVLIHPFLFEPRSLPKFGVTLRKPANNAIRVNPVPAAGYTLWIGPEHVADINQRILVESRGPTKSIEPNFDITVILEDLRRRADRQHPFWIRADF